MEVLPTELYQTIFLMLDQKEKVECLTVCRKWESLIKRYCLFHTVRLSKYDRLAMLIQRLKQDPRQGRQMEKLIIEQCHCTGAFIDLNELLLLLSNLRVFYVRSRSHIFRITKPIIVPWHESIKRLIIGDPLLIDRFLTCNNNNECFYNLRTLVMNGLNLDENNLFDILSKAPSLNDLRMRLWSFSTSALERLHSMLPLLTTLTVQLNFLDSGIAPIHIQPAPFMKSFHLIYSNKTTRRANLDWLNYISKKYTELSEIQYREDTYVYNIRSLTVAQRNRIESELLSGFRSLFQVLGPKLHNISITSPSLSPDVFTVMDSNLCQCSRIDFNTDKADPLFHSFMQSNQIHSIQKLKLGQLENVNHVKHLSTLTTLEELSLSFIGEDLNKKAIDIKDILDCCPTTLKSLEIHRLTLTSSCTPSKLRLLGSLTFISCDFEKDVDLFLAQSLPQQQLDILSTVHCLYYSNRFVLLNIQLSHFHVIYNPMTFDNGKVPNLQTKTRDGDCLYVGKSNEGEWDFLTGFIRTDEFPLYYPTEPIFEFDENAYLTLECAAVEEVLVLYDEF